MHVVASKDGTRIAYWRQGKGRPLVLIHGSTADHSRWDAMVPVLANDVTTCAMDRRGRGASGDAAAYDVEREYEDAIAVIDAEAARAGGPVDVFGHSFGALCALEAAIRSRSVRRLTLYEPVLLADASAPDFAARADALLAAGDRDAVVELFFRVFLGASDAEIAAYRAQPSWKIRVAAAHTLPREDRAENAYRFDAERIRTLKIPTLLLAGSKTAPMFTRSTHELARAMPDHQTHVLEGQDHFAIVKNPQSVADAVLPFLLGTSRVEP